MQAANRECPPLAGRHFDVLIIGGGINGVAIARECVRSGKSVLLVEQHDFASGTTSRSTRIIHGGLRYLEHGEIDLVRESLRERERLLAESPHLVRPLQFLLALPKEPFSLLRSTLAIRTGLWLYRHWAGREHTKLTGREFEHRLDSEQPLRLFAYEDAQCEFPERLTAEWLTEATDGGAVARNHTRALEIVRDKAAGRATGARLQCQISGEEYAVSARWIVNASGPWADTIVSESHIPAEQMIGGIRGSHLVFPRFSGGPEQAIYTEAIDGRPIFVIPWNGQVLVGTSEVADGNNPSDPQPSSDEIDYLFRSFTRLFPCTGLTQADIRYSFAGIRPLPYTPKQEAAAITRRHIIHDHDPEGAAGMISIIGGKLTTAASLAREVAEKLGIHPAQPAMGLVLSAPANGLDSTLHQWSRLAADKAGISIASAEAIAEWHGRRSLAVACSAAHDERWRDPLCSHTSHIVAEAVEAVHYEHAVTLGDILLRRVPVALGACWSEACSQEAAQKIGAALGWEDRRIHRELEEFEQERERFLHPNSGVRFPREA
ncbi:MAG TPA: glycerol-3-phosphate dehydrogenase/oxidase [Candidatus Angelobacter sp.]|nr:glycerol-3-phosphate dehydrogenase/oxidase [Candidatus Angelobacter sp.]